MKKIFLALFSLLMAASAFSERIGLVLSGGGAKGAYEVGIWKAMEEFGLTKKVTVISGASVGALNAGLFACTTQEDAKRLWENEVGFSSFLMPDINNLSQIGNALYTAYNSATGKEYLADENEDTSSTISKIRQILSKAKDVGKEELSVIGKFLFDYCLGDEHTPGLFKRDALRDILYEYISLDKLKESGVEVYCTTLRKEYLALKAVSMILVDDYSHNFKLNEQLSDQNARDIMLASSALPIAYESQPLPDDIIEKGKKTGKTYEYIDGGFEAVGGKNTPVRPVALSSKVDTIFVVYLADAQTLKEDASGATKKSDGLIPETSAKGKKMIHFVPSENLGNMFTGVINFSQDKIDQLIDLGYKDGVRILQENGYKTPLSFFRNLTGKENSWLQKKTAE